MNNCDFGHKSRRNGGSKPSALKGLRAAKYFLADDDFRVSLSNLDFHFTRYGSGGVLRVEVVGLNASICYHRFRRNEAKVACRALKLP